MKAQISLTVLVEVEVENYEEANDIAMQLSSDINYVIETGGVNDIEIELKK